MKNTSFQVIVKRGSVSYGKFFSTLNDAKSFFFDEFAGGTCTIYKVQGVNCQAVAGYSN